MVQKHLLNLYHARTAGMLTGARRAAMLLLTTLLLTMTAQTAWADTGYNYKGADGTMRNTYTDDHIPDDWVTVLTDGTSYLSEGWNYVSGNINLTNGINVSTPQAETDHYFQLILADGASLTINLESSSCIYIGERCSLTIYGQTNGTGTLNVTSQNYSHAIEGGTGSSITLYGGIINANAGGSNCGIYVNNIYLAGATVYASSYGGNVSASCKYKDSDNNEYEGSIYDTGAIAGKTLTPFGTVASTSVMLDPQGGSGGTESVTVTNGAAMPTITPPTRTGYTFGGYYDGMDGAGTKYYNADGSSANNWNHTGESFVLSAKWTANTYTVNLDPQEGSGGTGSVTVTYDAAMPSATMPTRTGYIFCGYFTGTNGGGIKYYNADGSSAHTWDITTDNTTLYANWTAKQYTVTLDQQGGSGGTTSVNATYASAMPEIELPTKTGYDFDGYYTETNGGGTQYYNANGTSARTCDLTAAVTLYAKWTAKQYTVALYHGGGENGSYEVTATYGAAMPAITLPTKTGYTFGGYFTEPNGNGTQYYNADGSSARSWGIDANTTLLAHWKKCLSNTEITIEIPAQTYSGSQLTPVVTVKDNGSEVSDAHYTISLPVGRTNAGDYTINIEAKEGSTAYAGSKTATFTINQKNLTVTANNHTISYGDGAENDGVIYSGFVNGEDQNTEGIFGTTTLTYAYKTANDITSEDYTTSSPEGTYYIIPSGLTATNYNITFAAGTLTVVHSATLFAANSSHLWATFCDTYERTIPEGCTAYTIKSISGTTVTLSTALTTTIPAYTPVLVKRATSGQSQDIKPKYSADDTAPANYNSTTGIVTSAATGWAFYGNPGTDAFAANNAIYTAEGGFIHEGHDATGTASYVLRDGQFILVDENQGLAAHRCLLNVSATAGARKLNIVIDDGDVMGITTTDYTDFTDSNGAWYSLDGRKLDGEPTKKGLYINNGKKIAIK